MVDVVEEVAAVIARGRARGEEEDDDEEEGGGEERLEGVEALAVKMAGLVGRDGEGGGLLEIVRELNGFMERACEGLQGRLG